MSKRFVEIAQAANEAWQNKNGVDVVKFEKTVSEFKKLFQLDYKGPKPAFKELMTANDFGILVQRVVDDQLQMPAEPEYLGVNLFTRTIKVESNTQIRFPSMSAIKAQRVPNNLPVPDSEPGITQHVMSVDATRVAVAMSFEEDLINDSMYNLLPFFTEAGRRALLRFKEEEVWKKCLEMAHVAFDNSNSSSSYWTTGKGSDSVTQNGSISLIDIIDMLGMLGPNGYTPTDFLANPLAWATWHKDPIMMAQFYHAGQIGQDIWRKTPGISSADSQSLFPWGIVYHSTRFMPVRFNTTLSGGLPAATGAANLTDMLLIDRNDPLVILEREAISSDQIKTQEIETIKLVMKEKYSVFAMDQARSAIQAKNVRLVPNAAPLFTINTVNK